MPTLENIVANVRYRQFRLNRLVSGQVERTAVAAARIMAWFSRPLAARAYRSYGNGENRARIPFAAQPRALRIGDQLVSGDFVLAEPREGYNGSVRLLITGGWHGHEIDVPARIPIAIWPRH